MKIGLPRDYFGTGLNTEVKEAVLAAAKKLEGCGAVIEEFNLGLVEYAIPAYYVIACAEASSNLARFDGIKYGYRTKQYEGLHNLYKKSRSEGFGPEVKRRIMLGSFVLFRQCYLYIVSRFISNTVLPLAMGYPAGWLVCSTATLLYYRRVSLKSNTLGIDLPS